MSIKKSQAVLKCFINLKSNVWFTLGSEDETMFCYTFSARLPVMVLKTLNDRQSLYSLFRPLSPAYLLVQSNLTCTWFEVAANKSHQIFGTGTGAGHGTRDTGHGTRDTDTGKLQKQDGFRLP